MFSSTGEGKRLNTTSKKLQHLSGSKQLEDAIDWMLEVARSEGLDNAYTEDVTVPVWVRNNESLWMTRPRLQELNMLALGRSVGTPPGGIRAEVLVVRDFKDLERQAKKAAGKIVVYNSRWRNYHEAVQYRMSGAVRAAKVGAVATLVSSLTPFSLNTPHTGYQTYGKSLVKIPAAYITVEDAAMLERMQRRGQKVEVVLTMGAQNSPATTSRNTVTEVKGREWPRQVVVVSGHLDSWDVGQGALDDGGSLHSPDERYFWYHHSHGDTLSVIESGLLDLCLAVWTVIAYVTADITHNLPHLSL
ncbi:Carboxypeptidase Q-like 3 [Homarus americanus]|uniref:Carboxypeptidase Q n=1 Tax=Homarus americanus TaxID=6706 RepID=A0A8J5MQ98_HOMAM|nr:Carboxypeptidase Q-like 3 [Homarus americanus]